jgi:hypothetical protein
LAVSKASLYHHLRVVVMLGTARTLAIYQHLFGPDLFPTLQDVKMDGLLTPNLDFRSYHKWVATRSRSLNIGLSSGVLSSWCAVSDVERSFAHFGQVIPAAKENTGKPSGCPRLLSGMWDSRQAIVSHGRACKRIKCSMNTHWVG